MKIANISDSPALKNEQGIALLMILWIITLLSVICAEFSWTMRSETVIVRNFKESEQAYYTAEAGVNRAIIELVRSAKNLRIKKRLMRKMKNRRLTTGSLAAGLMNSNLGKVDVR